MSIYQISFKGTDFVIYHIEYVDAYIEKKNEDKYLIFALTGKDKEALENYTELWDEIKDQIETISGNKPVEYKKDFMKIKFEPDDDLPLGKLLNIPVCIITVFQENNNYYPQVFLHECFYEYEYELSISYIKLHKFQYSSFSMHQLHKVSFIHELHKVSFIHCFCFIRQNLFYSTYKWEES